MAKVLEAGVERHDRDRAFGLGQEFSDALHPQALQILHVGVPR